MGLTLRIPNEIPLTNQQLDDNFTYLLGLINDLNAAQTALTSGNETSINVIEGVLDDKQPLNDKLTSISLLSLNGVMVLSDSSVLIRQIVSSDTNNILITNPAGQAGDIGINIGPSVLTTSSTNTVTNKSLSGQSNTFTNISLQTAVTDILPVVNGGTGSSTAAGARSNLNVLVDTPSTGIVVKTANDTTVNRSITVEGIGLSVTNSTGVDGNPKITLSAATTNTANTLVARDSSGAFSAGSITATELLVNKGSSVYPHIRLDGKGFLSANTDLRLVYSLSGSDTTGQFIIGKKSDVENNVTKVFSINNSGQIKSEIANYENLVTEDNVIPNKKYVDTKFVDVSGDTMTNFLTLHADPVNPLHAATKKYIDSKVSGSAIPRAAISFYGNAFSTVRAINCVVVRIGTGHYRITLDPSVVNEFLPIVILGESSTASGYARSGGYVSSLSLSSFDIQIRSRWGTIAGNDDSAFYTGASDGLVDPNVPIGIVVF